MFQSSSSNESDSGSVPTKPEWQILEKVATASVTEQRKARRWGIFFKLLTFFYLFVIIASLLPKESSLGPVYDEHVALVSLDGVIAADAPANANTVVAGLRDAFADGSSKAVILSINSPGGSPVQSGYINVEIYRLKALYPEKKLYAVIADLGASGGYYVASAADEIYADKASLVGSIGVISAGFGFEKLIETGADDVEFFDQRAFVYCPTEELNTIANFMETNGFEDISCKIIWKAKEPLKIGFEQLQKVAKLIEALEDDEDVRFVTSNFEASDEDLEALSG